MPTLVYSRHQRKGTSAELLQLPRLDFGSQTLLAFAFFSLQMDRGQFHLLSCLRSRASGYSEDASDGEIVQLMKEAQAGDYFITSRLSGPFPRFQIFLSFQFADSGLYRTFIQNLRSNSPDLQTLPVEVQRDASSKEQSLVYSYRHSLRTYPEGCRDASRGKQRSFLK